MGTPSPAPHLTSSPAEPVPVAFTGRTSTLVLQDPAASLRRQVRECQAKLPPGWYIAAWFWDIESGGLAISERGHGSAHEQFTDIGIPRDGGLADLLAEAASPAPRFAAVICEDIERSGRDTYYALQLEKQLTLAGIPLFATDEPIDVTGANATTVLVRRVKQGVAEWFRLQIKEKAWRGLREHSLAGWNIGTPPYGYLPDRVPHPVAYKAAQGRTKTRLVLDLDRAPAVAAIFQWRTTGKAGGYTIATRLNADPALYPPPARTGAWSEPAVYAILRNPKYTGYMVFGRRRATPDGRSVPVPADQWLWSPEPTHPAIITRAMWDAAQVVGAEHGTSRDDPGPNTHPATRRTYVLRSRVRCRSCQRRMTGVTRSSPRYWADGPDFTYTYYACHHNPANPRHIAAEGQPRTISVREEHLLEVIRGFFNTHVFGPDRADLLTADQPASAAEDAARRDRQAAALTKQLRQIDAAENAHAREIESLAHLNNPHAAAVTALRTRILARFTELEDQRTRITGQLTKLTAAHEGPGDPGLLDALPHLDDPFSGAATRLLQQLFQAFDLQALYNNKLRQVTIRVTITDSTPQAVARIINLADDHPHADDVGLAAPEFSELAQPPIRRKPTTIMESTGANWGWRRGAAPSLRGCNQPPMLMPMPTDAQVTAGDPGGHDDPATALGGRDYGATLWEPSEQSVRDARITDYLAWLRDTTGQNLAGYDELWQWSVAEPEEFWASVWDYFDVLGRRGDGPVLAGGPMPDVHWFGGTTLNYARNALRLARTHPDQTAVIFRSEAGRSGALSYAELAAEVARVREGLRALGVTAGDRVAAFVPNIPEALAGLLATASLGAIWSSCSPDFGAHSVIDRLAQISPKVLIAVDGYPYGGKWFDRRQQVADIVAELPSLETLITVNYGAVAAGEGATDPAGEGWTGAAMKGAGEVGGGPRRLDWAALPPGGAAAEAEEFAEVPFDHPLWVLYSSGTTGLPKPIVHGHGGVVLEHLKAMALHQDLGAGDVFFWYTTTGWMMWNYLAGGLLVGAAIVLYDGSATHPGTGALWQLAAETGVTYFGTGAPYLLACMKAELRPGREHDLSRVRGIGSTGSPLPPEGFRWVYDAVASEGGPGGKGREGGRMTELLLGSFSGGTDLCTGFVGPSPLLPVRSGVISGRCLGADVQAFDDAGQPVTGQVGELVITRPMPSMPVGFWNDPGGERYRDSYFADYPGVWRHGDWIMFLPDGGCIIYGRSDATLNRGGVRMGTSEFYRIVEALPEVADSLVIDTGRLGQDGRLILYVVPAAGSQLDDDLAGRIRSGLRSGLSPRHVPDEIHQVPGIPRTLSGKKLEVPVRKILLGTPVADAADPDALANPEVLESFVPRTGSQG